MPGISGGASTGIKALRGGEKSVDAGKHGSYTVTFESGNRYHGKGSTSRMEQSAREKPRNMVMRLFLRIGRRQLPKRRPSWMKPGG